MPIYSDQPRPSPDGKYLWVKRLVYSKGAIRETYQRLIKLKDLSTPINVSQATEPTSLGVEYLSPETLPERVLRMRIDLIEAKAWEALATGRF